jgi:hypothetical protein
MNKLLVQYQGGGYDGCFWEWNYFYFDSEGQFHNLISSGRKGIKNESEAMALMFGDDDNSWGSRGLYIYDLNLDNDIQEFFAENAEMSIANVMDKVNKIDGDIIYLVCSDCGDKIYNSKDLFPTGYKGNGGVGIIYSGYVCSDCYCGGSCGNCGEYYGVDLGNIDLENIADQLGVTLGQITEVYTKLNESCGPFCEYCAETLIKKELIR